MCKTKKTNCRKAITMIMLITLIALTTMCSQESKYSVTKFQTDHDYEIGHDFPSFDENLHASNKLFVVFDHLTTGTLYEGFMPEKDGEGNIQIGYESFDKLAQKYGIIEMFQERLFFYPQQAMYGICLGYVQTNVFTLTLQKPNMIEKAVQEMLKNDAVYRVTYVKKGLPPYTHGYPVSLLICFDYETLGFFEWEFNYHVNDKGEIQIGIDSFDYLAAKYNFTDFYQLYLNRFYEDDLPYGKHSPLNNVFRIGLDDVSNIEDILTDLLNDSSILSATYGSTLWDWEPDLTYWEDN